MINFARIVNKLWLSSQRNDHKYFIQNISNASHIQQELLMKYIGQNTNSAFGIDHDFRWIDSYEQFCEKVPIIEDYSMLDSYIDRIKLGENNILTKEKVLFMETTSGTSAASKFIPYTSSLRSEFQKALAVWMTESHRLNPEAFSGKAYWSISPPLKSNGITSGGLRIGIESDTEYLNPWMAKLMSMVLSVPAQNIRASSSEEFYMELCSRLLADENLSFISVWSPNYFLQLHNFILKNREVLFNNNYLSKKRKTYLSTLGTSFQWKELFPNLVLISCWTEAQSALWIPELKKYAKGIQIQAKGLLSTEGVVTTPFNDGNILCYTSHFYEFREVETRQIFRCHELIKGRSYEVILTTGGGLCRYVTGDVVSVTANEQQLPYLNFIGKSSEITDMTGEKISAIHLYPFFNKLISDKLFEVSGLFLHPVKADHQIQYELIVEAASEKFVEEIRSIVEEFLLQNPYYQQSRNTGQLKPLITKYFRPGLTIELSNYYKKQKEIKDGDVKLPILFPFGFLDVFLKKWI